MEALKTTGYAKDGLLTIRVPDQFDEQEVEVIILSNTANEKSSFPPAPEARKNQDKIARRLSIIGTAKNFDAPVEDYDVYDQ